MRRGVAPGVPSKQSPAKHQRMRRDDSDRARPAKATSAEQLSFDRGADFAWRQAPTAARDRLAGRVAREEHRRAQRRRRCAEPQCRELPRDDPRLARRAARSPTSGRDRASSRAGATFTWPRARCWFRRALRASVLFQNGLRQCSRRCRRSTMVSTQPKHATPCSDRGQNALLPQWILRPLRGWSFQSSEVLVPARIPSSPARRTPARPTPSTKSGRSSLQDPPLPNASHLAGHAR
jgi:hypothetical protein